MADGPYDFGQVFIQSLARGLENRQAGKAQQSLETFRRDSLNEQARQAKKGEEIQGLLIELRRETEAREKVRDEATVEYQGRMAGAQEKAVETDAARETRLAEEANRTIPVPTFLRKDLGVDSLPAGAYGAGVTSAGQAYVMRQSAQLSRELKGGAINPENVKFVTSEYLSGLGEINSAIGSLDPQSVDYADQYDTFSKTANALRAGLFSVLVDPQTSQHVNINEILEQLKAVVPPPNPQDKSTPEPEQDAQPKPRGQLDPANSPFSRFLRSITTSKYGI